MSTMMSIVRMPSLPLSAVMIGNFFHKTAVLSGIACIITNLIPMRPVQLAVLPLGATALTCVTLYDLSWSSDPICKYQRDANPSSLSQVPSSSLNPSGQYVVFVRRDDSARKTLHNTIGAICAVVIGAKLAKLYWH